VVELRDRLNRLIAKLHRHLTPDDE
jgi:hypothetical protein